MGQIDMRTTAFHAWVLMILICTGNVAHADFVSDAQAHAAKAFRKQLPVKVDENTTLLTVGSAGRTLIYSYRVNAHKKNLPSDWQRRQNSHMENNLCNHPKMRTMLKRGASYSYQYVDVVGELIAYFTVANSNC
jgi:hypothetical protein